MNLEERKKIGHGRGTMIAVLVVAMFALPFSLAITAQQVSAPPPLPYVMYAGPDSLGPLYEGWNFIMPFCNPKDPVTGNSWKASDWISDSYVIWENSRQTFPGQVVDRVAVFNSALQQWIYYNYTTGGTDFTITGSRSYLVHCTSLVSAYWYAAGWIPNQGIVPKYYAVPVDSGPDGSHVDYPGIYCSFSEGGGDPVDEYWYMASYFGYMLKWYSVAQGAYIWYPWDYNVFCYNNTPVALGGIGEQWEYCDKDGDYPYRNFKVWGFDNDPQQVLYSWCDGVAFWLHWEDAVIICEN